MTNKDIVQYHSKVSWQFVVSLNSWLPTQYSIPARTSTLYRWEQKRKRSYSQSEHKEGGPLVNFLLINVLVINRIVRRFRDDKRTKQNLCLIKSVHINKDDRWNTWWQMVRHSRWHAKRITLMFKCRFTWWHHIHQKNSHLPYSALTTIILFVFYVLGWCVMWCAWK